jgi:hypothetical protein
LAPRINIQESHPNSGLPARVIGDHHDGSGDPKDGDAFRPA